MNENNIQYSEYNYRAKRTEYDYNNHSNQKIMLNFENKNENGKTNNIEYINSNSNKDINKDEFMNNYQNNVNNDLLDISSNDNTKDKYPNFQSFLQLNPKEDIEIPTIKYYNYIFNIGSPSN